jgi:glucose-6-phosphate isomerase
MDRLPAYSRLRAAATHPFDLTAPGALSPRRIASYVCRATGFDLLYATQRVDDAVLDALQDLADQTGAVGQFLAMKSGQTMNRIEGYESENRQVLHTACRDLFLAPPHHPEATTRAREQLEQLRSFLADLEAGRVVNGKGEPFSDLIHLGIGGSDLGPRALALALDAYRTPGRRLHFISNVDPDDAAGTLRGADLARSLVVVVSKSGTTLETLTNEEMVKAAFLAAGLRPEDHFVAVTGRGSPMDSPAKYLRSFHMFDYIGGRYSSTSMVGGVTLAFALGYDAFLDLLRGANEMDRAAEEPDVRRNPALLLALLGVWNRNFLGHQTVAVLPYSQALGRFPAHLQQCDMESNGKSVTRQGESVCYPTGPIVWGEPGTNGQHAFYQLLHQGSTVVPAEFIGFRRCQYGEDLPVRGTTSQQKLLANLLAQVLALATGKAAPNPNRAFPGNRPSSLLLADRLSPFSMGALLALYEAKIAFQGFVWNINSFDQEGVQLGKVLATRLLDHLADAGTREARDTEQDPVGSELLRTAGLL